MRPPSGARGCVDDAGDVVMGRHLRRELVNVDCGEVADGPVRHHRLKEFDGVEFGVGVVQSNREELVR